MHLDVVEHRVETNFEAWIPHLLRGGAIAFSLLSRVAVSLINRALEHLQKKKSSKLVPSCIAYDKSRDKEYF